MKLATATPKDFSDRFAVVISKTATPVDWDAAVAKFILKYLDGQSADPAAGLSIYNPGEIED